MKQVTKAWFDPEVGGYIFFDETGKEIVFGSLDASVTIADNWSRKGVDGQPCAMASIDFVVQIVNEKPKP